MSAAAPLRVFIVAGESSGDALGGKLALALRRETGGAVELAGVGGPAMAQAGIDSLFPIADIAVMGIAHIVPALPRILRRLDETLAHLRAFEPDILVVIDSPEFTQRLAKRARTLNPRLTIVKYVAPQIWAWRRGRARRMRAHIDHVLALLPFEPEVYRAADGPPTTYVGHPLIEALDTLVPSPEDLANRARAERPTIVVLPGSRASEVARLMTPFGRALDLLARRLGPLDVVLPAVPHLSDLIRARARDWSVTPRIVTGEEGKRAAFRSARAALAASGTVTLELALAGVPTAVAYRVDPFMLPILGALLRVETVVLANLVLGARVMPEFLQWRARPAALADALAGLLVEGPARAAQIEGLAATADRLRAAGETPSIAAARATLAAFEAKTGRRAPR